MTESNPTNNPLDQVIAAIDTADEAAALARVDALRETYPDVNPDALVGMLIKQKCLQSGAIGEVTSSASVIPKVGVFVSLIFGGGADAALTAKLQAELVLEIAAVYRQQLDDTTRKRALVMVAGNSPATSQLLEVTGQKIARAATETLAQQGDPETRLQSAASAGTNIVSTYLVGQRAKTYFKSDQAVEATPADEPLMTPHEEATLVTWLIETTLNSWNSLSQNAQTAAGAVITAGKSLGEVVIKTVSSDTGQILVAGASQLGGAATDSMVATGKTLSKRLLPGETGQSVAGGVEFAGKVSKKVGSGLLGGLGQLGRVAADLLRNKASSKKKRGSK